MRPCFHKSYRSLSFGIVAAGLLCATAISVSAQVKKDEPELAPTRGNITGRVVTESGQPLPNATVSIRGSQSFSQPRMANTDSEGNFQVTGLDSLLYGVFAASPSYIMTPRDPESQPDYYRIGDSVTVSLVKGGVITGAVQSAYGEPIVQIMVRAVMVRDANGQPPKYTAFQMQRPTDDRGIYRIYGLLPGTYVVGTANRGGFSGFSHPYESDASTYAPSSTRDTAVEVAVRAGEETGGVDIRYRAEPGRTVSGFVSGLEPNAPSNVIMFQVANGVRVQSGFAFQQPGAKGFAITGVSEGDYELLAQASRASGDISVSEPHRFTVKGSNMTGIELSLKPLGSILGRVNLEKSESAECRNKRQPLFSETLLVARRSEKSTPPEQPRLISFLASQGSPTKDGEFQLRNLAPGTYNLSARFFARYWYLRSISREAPPSATANKPVIAKRQLDLARDGVLIKFGERQRDVIFTLTEGAGSIRGKIDLAPGETIPAKLHVHLIPAEKESAEDVLRYFSDEAASDGFFNLSNLPPGRYWAVAVVAGAKESHLQTAIRLPEEKELRARIRRTAEAAKNEIELKPCQNITDYSLSRR